MNGVSSKLIIGLVAFGNNTAKYLPYFLASLKTQGYQNFEIFVQDNSEVADNKNVELFKRHYPDVKFVWSGGNIGFAKAYNKLIKRAIKAGAKFFLALNCDMLLDTQAIEKMIDMIEQDASLGSVAPKIYKWDFANQKKINIIDSCGILEKSALRFIDLGQGQIDDGSFDGMKIIGPSGASALYRLSALEKIKEDEQYFDEKMFMYFEDCDLAYRLKLAGYKSCLVPSALVYHDRTASAQGQGDWSVVKNRKNKPRSIKKWSFLNKHIIFWKFWNTLNWRQKFAVGAYTGKMFFYALFFEVYLLKEYKHLWQISKSIKVYRVKK